ncbi:hypothetical protein [Natronomonas marina]|jgi:hypothetical protein|uniref:hypothetical protein n=1 Tax=Natronomonas marina TaxID=2961939 RepID=UPI0020C9C8D2|nr:hypothetical protein [Natronomonas marina]
MTIITGAISIQHDTEAAGFDTAQTARQPRATADTTLTPLADWKGERSRRVPGEASREGPEVPRPARAAQQREDTGANGVSEEHSEACAADRREAAKGERRSREPRAHESARASEVSAVVEATENIRYSPNFQHTSYQ